MVESDPDVLSVLGEAGTRDLATTLFRRAGLAIRNVGSGEAALAAVEDTTPKLLLIDLTLADMSGYELCYEVRQRFGPDIPIILLSEDRNGPHDGIASLLIGADDHLNKPFHPDELLARARRLMARSTPERTVDHFGLTPREIEVLGLLAKGLGREAIAKELFISVKTVATHVEHILTKLRVHSGMEAVAVAYRAGLVQESSGGSGNE